MHPLEGFHVSLKTFTDYRGWGIDFSHTTAHQRVILPVRAADKRIEPPTRGSIPWQCLDPQNVLPPSPLYTAWQVIHWAPPAIKPTIMTNVGSDVSNTSAPHHTSRKIYRGSFKRAQIALCGQDIRDPIHPNARKRDTSEYPFPTQGDKKLPNRLQKQFYGLGMCIAQRGGSPPSASSIDNDTWQMVILQKNTPKAATSLNGALTVS